MSIIEKLKAARVVPVIEIRRSEDAAPLAESLMRGGVTTIELTLRSDAALASVAAMRSVSSELIIGMGTITSQADAHRSLEAGAQFLVSPGASAPLLSALAACGAPAFPGVATTSEAMVAIEAGFKVLKFFPAEASGGFAFLKAIAGPFPELQFIPTGGIDERKAFQYLGLANVVCVGGSWIAPQSLIAAHDWRGIEANATRAARL